MSNINLSLQKNQPEKSIGQKLCDYLAINTSNTILFQALDRIEKGLDSEKVNSFWQNVCNKSELPYEEVVKLSIEKQIKVLKAAIAKKPILAIQEIAKDRKKEIEDLRLEKERLELSIVTQVSVLVPSDKLQEFRERLVKTEELPNAETIRNITSFYSDFKEKNNISVETIGLEKFEYFESIFNQIVENLSFDDYRDYKLPLANNQAKRRREQIYLDMAMNVPFRPIESIRGRYESILNIDLSDIWDKTLRDQVKINQALFPPRNKNIFDLFNNWANSKIGKNPTDEYSDFPKELLFASNLPKLALNRNQDLFLLFITALRVDVDLRDKKMESAGMNGQSFESDIEKKDRKTVDEIIGFVKKVNDLATSIKPVNAKDKSSIRTSANKLKTLDAKAKEEIERKCKKFSQSNREIEFIIWGVKVENALLKSSLFSELFGNGNEWDNLIKRLSAQVIDSNPSLQGNTLFLKNQVSDKKFDLEDENTISGLINLTKHILADLPEELFNFNYGLSDYGKNLLKQKKLEILGIGEGVKSSEAIPIKIDLEPVRQQILEVKVCENDAEVLKDFLKWVSSRSQGFFDPQNSDVMKIITDRIDAQLTLTKKTLEEIEIIEDGKYFISDSLINDLLKIVLSPEFLAKYVSLESEEIEKDIQIIKTHFISGNKSYQRGLSEDARNKLRLNFESTLDKYDTIHNFLKCFFPDKSKTTQWKIDMLESIKTLKIDPFKDNLNPVPEEIVGLHTYYQELYKTASTLDKILKDTKSSRGLLSKLTNGKVLDNKLWKAQESLRLILNPEYLEYFSNFSEKSKFRPLYVKHEKLYNNRRSIIKQMNPLETREKLIHEWFMQDIDIPFPYLEIQPESVDFIIRIAKTYLDFYVDLLRDAISMFTAK